MTEVKRGGRYWRIVEPDWRDPADISYSRAFGGRWNPAGEFGALSLNATLSVAAANARARHAGRALKLFDLLPAARPHAVAFDVPPTRVVDVVSAAEIAAVGLPPSYPFGVGWPPCQAIARATRAAGAVGVACRSAAEATATWTAGEELALFEGGTPAVAAERLAFAQWYPDPIPGGPS